MRTSKLLLLAMVAGCGAPATVAPAPPAPAPAEEIRLPEFDLATAEASYVLAVPPGYDASTKWPLLVDFHGACHPSRKGATLTRRELWSRFVRRVPCIVVGLNGRTTAWGMTKGDRDDRAYARRVIAEVKRTHSIDPARLYLGGFSSGSDFLCTSGIQLDAPFAGSIVVCPGPPNVVGLSDGSLLKVKGHRFCFVAGEEDYIRKDGAWGAFLALDRAGADVTYREVPGTAHEFPDIDEYVRAFERLDGPGEGPIAAFRRGDYLRASSDETLRAEIERRGGAMITAAETIKEPGAAFEAWWQIRTQMHRFEAIASRAQRELDALKVGLKPRGEFFDARHKLGAFDRYLTLKEIVAHLRDLARRFPTRVKLESIGLSIEQRDIWALAITDSSTGPASEKPAAYIEGAIHGNEASAAMTALYVAWQLAANPEKSRGIDRLLATHAVYVVPVANPDGLHHYMTGAHTTMRPRYNFRPHDADKDGRIDEDPYDDLDGDGEIADMYRVAEKGTFVLKDGRMATGAGSPRYELLGTEGLDDDGDGRVNEDRPGGVDLNRNFPVGFHSRKEFEGTTGAAAASEPETQAIMSFVSSHPNIGLFLDYHNDAKCVFYWRPGDAAELYRGVAERAEKALGYKPAPLDHEGAGLAIAWSTTQGIPSFIVELESGEPAFIPAHPFNHPQLGDIILYADATKLSKRNPRPDQMAAVAARNFAWIRGEIERLPRMEIRDPRIEKTADGIGVSGEVRNAGEFPTGGAGTIAAGTVSARFGPLAGGESIPFRLQLPRGEEPVALVVQQARAGVARLAMVSARSATRPVRTAYSIESGYATPDQAVTVELTDDRGPAFKLNHSGKNLNVAVLLGEWKDRRHAVPPSEFEKAFFSEGAYTGASFTGQPVYGSVRDFYRETSFGECSITGRVFDWVELPGDYASYRDASFGESIIEDRLLAGVLKRDGEKALDGYNAIAFIWAGNMVSRVSTLWPMRINVKSKPDTVAFKTSELYRGQMMPVGVPAHEIGHTFGVDDKYGLGSGTSPLGPWCLMGLGTHGGAPSTEHRPFPMCAWCRMVIGWVKPAIIDPSTPQKLALRPITSGPRECYRVLIKADGSEYLLLENRQAEGSLTDCPSVGLAILRVGPNDKPASPQVRVQLVPASAAPASRRGAVGDPAAVAWPQKGKTEVVVEGVKVGGIRMVDGVVYCEVSRP